MKKIIALFSVAVLLPSCSEDDGTNPIDNTPALVVTTLSASESSTSQLTFTTGGTVAGGIVVLEHGICWSPNATPTVFTNKVTLGSGNGNFGTTVDGQAPDSSFRIKAYAITATDTVYGSEITLQTKPFTMAGAGVTDECGNNYATVILNDREWMAENLRATCYQDGTPISLATKVTWNGFVASQTGVYMNYGNDATIGNDYGKLYSWYAVTSSHNISPEGWSVPSQEDYQALEQYIMNYLALDQFNTGRALKTNEAGFWIDDAAGTNNATNFSAVPGGNFDIYNNLNDGYQFKNEKGSYWTNENSNLDGVIFELKSLNHQFVPFGKDKVRFAGSVRCIKNL